MIRPEDTPWEGGTFFLRIEISEQYPETAPSIRFVNYLFHPNSRFLDVEVTRSLH